MARNRSKPQALLFEELEPRLLFSADIAEPVAAEVVQEEVQEEVVIIIADAPEQIEAPADNVSENPAEIPSSADAQEQTQLSEDAIESSDGVPDTETEAVLLEPEAASSETHSADTNQDDFQLPTSEDTATDSSLITETETPSSIILDEPAAQRNELVLVNDNVRDIDELVAGIDLPENSTSTIEVVILDTERDGIEQVSEILADQENLDAIHIVTHGRDGYLALGSDWLNSEDLRENSDALDSWGDVLNEDGDILLYGCSIASNGQGEAFVELLADLTGADVAASDDPTGYDSLGGDWELEYDSGTIESSNPIAPEKMASWQHIMAATVGDEFNSISYSGNTGTVNWNNDWQELFEMNGAAAGNVSVYAHPNWGSQPALTIWKVHDGVWREMDLSGATTATLSFDYMLQAAAGEFVTVEISTDEGTSWSPIATFSGPASDGSLQPVSYDISSYIDNDTRIKFESSGFLGGSAEFVLDNVLIDFNISNITVDTEADILDGNTNSISELIADPGTDGNISLREAIEAANNTTGFDRITFNIPGTGPHVIILDQNLNALPYIDDAVYIDGSSEPDYVGTPVIQIDGSDLSSIGGDNYDGFRLDIGSDGSTMRGLSVTGFTDGGNWGQAFDIRSDNNVIAGNYIGLAPDGITPDGNNIGIILHNGADFNTIGGSSAADKNIISASMYAGVDIEDGISSDNFIVGNDIGLDANGNTIVSGNFGVLVWNGSSDNVIGGVNSSEGNRITGHREGVVIDNAANPGLNNAILGNEIWDNREMAIDLNNDGITDNDIGDIDSGPNDLLNFPVITSVSQNGSDLDVSFNLDAPAGDYRIEFFENPNGINGTGLGEGQSFLGALAITSTGTGFELFNDTLPNVTATYLATISATATEYFGGSSYGSTSEFGPSTTTIAALTAIKDTYLSNDTQTLNYGNSTSLMVDKDGGDLGNGRVLVQFDLSSIPSGATITSATLQLNATSNSAPFPINVYEVTEDWQEGTGGTGAADWDFRHTPEDPSSEWSNAGGTVDSTIIATLDTAATGTHSWDITSLAQAWYAGTTPNNGLMLASEESGGEIVTYDSREAANPPQLILTYSVPPNTAPVIDTSATPLLDPVLENNGAPSGAVGTLVSDLVDLQGGGGLDNVTDPDAGAQTGIALRFADEANGSWHYSTDDGLSWNQVGSIDNNNARLLAADSQTRIYFEANPGFTGTISDALVFKAWDQTSGVNGGLGDTTPSGGTTAFSSATETANMTVEATHDVKETVNPIIVDGVLDSAWSLTTTHDITHLVEGFVNNAADLSGTWRSMWDDTYLYALIEVNDNVIINDSGTSVWHDDSIGLYIDPDYSHGSSYDGINDYSLYVRAEDGAVFLGINSTSDTSGILSHVSSSPGSYIVEIAVPWTKFGVIPVDGSIVGMEVQINDDDSGFTRDAKLTWNDTADEAWMNPSAFGTMQLLENNPPTIGGTDTGTVTEDVDPDSDDLLEISSSLTITDADAGESSFIAGTLTGTYGDLTIDATGNWDYSADNTQLAIQELDIGQSVTDTLTVTTADRTTHDIIITINGAEDAPVLGGIATGTVNEDGSLTDNNTLTITDVDTNDNPIDFTDVGPVAGSGGYGTFQIVNNQWTYTLQNGLAAVQALDTGESLTDAVTFMASDGVSSQTVAITINGAEDAPTVDNPITDQIATEDSAFSFSFPGDAFGDLDASDTLIYTATLDDDSALPAWLSFSGATRTFSGTPANNDVGTINVKVTADDGTSTIADTFTITVINTDDPPVIGGTNTGTVTEDIDPDSDNLLEVASALSITDDDVGESSFIAETITGSYGELMIDAAGSWDYSADNTQVAIQQLDGGQSVTDILTVTTADGTTHTITITINGAEDAPVLGGIATGNVTEDGSLNDSSALTITDVDANDNPISYTNVASTAGDNGYGTFAMATNTWTYTLTNSLPAVQALDTGETLTDTFTFMASDGITSQTVTVTINGAEDAPTVDSPIADQTATEDSAFSFTFADTAFSDVDSSDTLTYTATLDDDSALPAWLSFTTATRTFSGTPANDDVGTINVKVTADDGTSSVFDIFTITVNNTDDPPVIGGTDTATVTEDIDPDSDNLLEVASALSISDDDIGESSFIAETINGTYGNLTIDALGNWDYSADNTQAAIQQLDGGQSVTDTLTVTTADGTTHDVVITINGAEDATVIGGITTGSVTEDGTLNDGSTLTITDVDANDNPISYNNVAATAGDNGYGDFTMAVNSWSYTLNNTLAAVQALDSGESLTDSFTFMASDGITSQTVTITINGAEDAPTLDFPINNQNATEDLPFTFTFNANTFGDPDTSDTLSYTATQDDDSPLPTWLNFDGIARTFNGTPLNADVGTINVKVTADDGTSTVFDTFSITVFNTSDPPVITGTDTGSVTEDDDPDLDNLLEASGSLTVVDPDIGESSFIADTITGAYGDLSIDSSGNWQYSADNTQAAIQQLDDGQSVTDTLSVTTFDGTSHDIVITINGTEDAPVIGGTATGSVTEDGSLSDSHTFTISDVDTNDNPISFNDVGPVAGSGGYGTFEIVSNQWTYSLDNGLAAVQALDVSETLTDSYTFTASDGSTQLVTVTINGAEDAPTVDSPIADQIATEDSAFSFTFANSDFGDVDSSDTLSYTASLDDDSALPAWLLFDGATRTFSGTPANSDVGTFDVKVTADDGSSTVFDIFTITVNNTDDPPVISGSDTGSVAEDDDPDLDDLLEAFGNLNIMDPDVGESSFVAETVTGTYGDLSIDAVGNWDYSADNTQAAIQQLDAGQSVTDTLTVTTADGTTHDIVITINGAEDAPVLGGTATGSVTEDGTLIDTDILTINDVDTNDNPLSFNDVGPVGGSGSYGTFEIFSNQWTYTLNNGLATVQALDVSEIVTDSYTFTASDGSTQLVTVTINGAEDAPTVDSPIADQTANEDIPFSFSFADTAFGDLDSSDTLSYTATLDDNSALPAWLSFSGATRTFSGTPANDDVGTITVKVSADDGTSSVFDTFTITVTNSDDPPVIGGSDSGMVTEDIDPDGDNLLEVASALSISDDDAGESSFVAETITGTYGDLSIDATGRWDYSADNTLSAIQQLDAGQSITDTLTVTTADGTTHDIVITINGAEDVPVVQNSIPDQAATEDAPFTFTFAANTFADPDTTDSLSYSATLGDDSALPSWLSFDSATRTFSGTPEDADVGIISVKVRASDGAGSVNDIFTITVTNTNDTPIAVDDTKDTTQNTSVTTHNVLANDTPGDGTTDVSSFDALSSFGGTVLYNSDGTFTYAPAAGFTGDDTFTYTISDSDGEVSTATVTVTVNPPVVTTPDPDPIEPDPDPEPIEPDPDPDPDPTDTEEETPADDPEPTTIIVPPDAVAEPALVDDVDEPSTEPDAKTVDKSSSDPADNTDTAATAAVATEVLQDPGFMSSATNDPAVPEEILAPVQEDHSSDSSTAASLLGKLEIDTTDTTTLLLKRYLDQIDFLSEVNYSEAIEQLRNALDEFKEEAESEDHYYQTVIGSAIAVSTGLSVGYVVWLIRGGMLLSSMLFSMPAWQLADPLPLLAGGRDEDEEDEETLETIIRDSAGKNGNNRITEAKTEN